MPYYVYFLYLLSIILVLMYDFGQVINHYEFTVHTTLLRLMLVVVSLVAGNARFDAAPGRETRFGVSRSETRRERVPIETGSRSSGRWELLVRQWRAWPPAMRERERVSLKKKNIRISNVLSFTFAFLIKTLLLLLCTAVRNYCTATMYVLYI